MASYRTGIYLKYQRIRNPAAMRQLWPSYTMKVPEVWLGCVTKQELTIGSFGVAIGRVQLCLY